jgi:hypothetical protein
MRALELGKIAAEAEKLRLEQLARRQTRRVIYLAIAAVFALGVLCMIHVLLWNVLALKLGPLWASAILLVSDIIIAGGFGFMGARSRPGRQETAAAEVRREALKQAQEAVLLALVPVATILDRRTVRGGLGFAHKLWRAFN